MPQRVPDAVRRHHDAVLDLTLETLALVRAMWAMVAPTAIKATWKDQLQSNGLRLVRIQAEAATLGADYVSETLTEAGGYVAPEAFVNPAGFAGKAPDGRSLPGLLAVPANNAVGMLATGAAPAVALARGGRDLDRIVSTLVPDISRAAAQVDIATRPGVGYVRMVSPGSCPRCSILAGRVYRWNQGFLRHPNCQCVHVPTGIKSTRGALAEGYIDDPYDHFNGLTEAEQDRLFGPAYAKAIREGADIYQVVNSKRGRDRLGLFTNEGVTRYGRAGQRLKRGQKRLTPEGIYRQAEKFKLTREETLGLLREHSYLLPEGQQAARTMRGRGFRAEEYETEAQRRLRIAQRNWREAEQGINPYSTYAPLRRQGSQRPWVLDEPLTDADRLRAEAEYKAALMTGGERYTAAGDSLDKAYAMYLNDLRELNAR